MILMERGKIQNGQIVLPHPLKLAEGTEVTVQIEPESHANGNNSVDDFFNLPFFGMWSDRQDMSDSASWVESERAKWQQRSALQG
ncbi:MAG: hypothetical protein SF097_00855 [Acidobacteriota bacterium]|nr:hypothetical protein [Acidobacteriota bacterium]